MNVSQQKSAYATVYTAIDAQGHPPIPLRNKQGVPQQLQRQLKKQVRNRRVGSWNVRTMTGRERDVVDVMERKVEILCVEETKWKGNTGRQLGNGYKLFYSGYDKTNGVGIVLSVKMTEKMVEVDSNLVP